MAKEENLRTISVEAALDLSSHQYRFMVLDTSAQLAVATAAAKSDGVLQDKPAAAGRAGSLATEGVTKCEAGEAITAGDDVSVGTAGKAAVATTGDVVVGRASSDAAGDGSIFSLLLGRQYPELA